MFLYKLIIFLFATMSTITPKIVEQFFNMSTTFAYVSSETACSDSTHDSFPILSGGGIIKRDVSVETSLPNIILFEVSPIVEYTDDLKATIACWSFRFHSLWLSLANFTCKSSNVRFIRSVCRSFCECRAVIQLFRISKIYCVSLKSLASIWRPYDLREVGIVYQIGCRIAPPWLLYLSRDLIF